MLFGPDDFLLIKVVRIDFGNHQNRIAFAASHCGLGGLFSIEPDLLVFGSLVLAYGTFALACLTKFTGQFTERYIGG